MHPLIHLLNAYVSGTYHIPGTVVCTYPKRNTTIDYSHLSGSGRRFSCGKPANTHQGPVGAREESIELNWEEMGEDSRGEIFGRAGNGK